MPLDNIGEISLTEKQIEFFEASYVKPVVFMGGARGGGKSYGLRSIVLLRALERRLNCVIFRRTYEELEANHIRPLLTDYPILNKFYNKTEHILKLPNGSVIEFCHCKREDDLYLYQGREFDLLAIDEAGQWTEGMFQTLRGSNRTSKPGVKPVTLLTGNPGGVGHGFLKRIFIDRDFNSRERPDDYFFISSRVFDCPPLIKNDPDYISRLEAEPNEMLRKAYLEGSWDIFAGQYFANWRREIHIVPRDFEIPQHWNRFGGYDHGFNHPYVFVALATDEDGNVYQYAECGDKGRTPDLIGKEILEACPKAKTYPIHAGHDLWVKGRDGSPEIVEQFTKMGFNMVRAHIDRKTGAQQLREYLDWRKDEKGIFTKKPRLYIKENCWRTIKQIPEMVYDEKNPEDVLKVDASETNTWAGDDSYDALRYSMMSRPRISEKPSKGPFPRHTMGWFRDKVKQENDRNRRFRA